MTKKIVIIGGGFAGVYTAKHLLHQIARLHLDLEVCLISNHNYFLFTPLLHEIATGGVSRDNAVYSLHKLLNHGKHFSFLKGVVQRIDTKEKMIIADTFKTSYDLLILATGSKINYFDIPNANEHAIPLRTLQDAYTIRNRVISQIELAEEANDLEKRKKLLTFAIIGGGSTGVELAGELVEYINTFFTTTYKRIKRENVTVILIHRGDDILPMLPVYYRRQCRKQLEQLGVRIHLHCNVDQVGKDFVHGCGKHYAGTIFWTAGFKAQTVPLDGYACSQYLVDETFAVFNKKDIFALGDCASIKDFPEKIPMLAQAAVWQSRYVAHNVLCRLGVVDSPLAYKHQLNGFLLSVGEYFAVAGLTFGKRTLYFSGFFAWWVWRTIYLLKLIGFRNKVRVAVDWTLHFFYPRDTSEIV